MEPNGENETKGGGVAPATDPVDQIRVQHHLEQMREKQRWLPGILGGAIGALIGAVIWALVTVMTDSQIGWIALLVGVLAGAGVRLLGRGVDKGFGVIGALLALLGCMAGNLLAIFIWVAKREGMPLSDIFAILDLKMMASLVKESFQATDLVFYAIAAFEGYTLGFKQVKASDLSD